MTQKIVSGLCLLLCAMLWGSTFVAQSLGADLMPPFAYNAIRFLIGAVVLLPMVAWRIRSGAFAGASVRRTIFGGLFCGIALCVASYFVQAGMSDTSAGKAGFISSFYILLVPLLRLLTGKRASRSSWLCVAIALMGMYLLCVRVGSFTLGYGDLMVLLSALFYSIHILAIDFIVADAEPVTFSCIQFAMTGLLSALLALAFEDVAPQAVWQCRGPLLYAGIFSCGIAYTLQVFGQRHADPMEATLLMSTESVFSAISGWVVLNERFSGREVAGCALIFSALLFGQLGGYIRNRNHNKRKDERE